MKMKRMVCWLGIVLTHGAVAKEFTNLNFDQGAIPPSPVNPFQPVELVLPGWTAQMGDHVLTEIIWGGQLGNAGTVSVERAFDRPTFEGRYGAVIAGGPEYPSLSPVVPASLSQNGLIPAGTQSLLFRADIGSPSEVRINDTALPIQFVKELKVGPLESVTLYGVNVSNFAGQEVKLSFVNYALPSGPRGFLFDSLKFSPVGVPEPSMLALFGLGATLLWWQARRSAR